MSVFVYLEGTTGWFIPPEQAPEAVSFDIQVFPGVLLPDKQLATAVETQQAPIVTSGIVTAGSKLIHCESKQPAVTNQADMETLAVGLTHSIGPGLVQWHK